MNYETIAWLCLIAAALLTDAFQTRWAVKNGYQEGWPIAQKFLKFLTMDQALILVKGLGMTFFVWLAPQIPHWALVVIALVSMVPVVWNARTINNE